MDYNDELRSVTPAIDTYIRLAQFPVLSDKIRKRMRRELFRRGIVAKADFYQEIRKMAMDSQRREGLLDPFERRRSGHLADSQRPHP